jgi:hypothetical protein
VAEDVEAFLRQLAPEDMQATVRWMLEHGYVLAGRFPAAGLSTFGSSLTYTGDAEVTVTVDRSPPCPARHGE